MLQLQRASVDFSATKQKAVDDAKRAQVSIAKLCAAAGEHPPPYVLSELIGKGSFGRVYKATGSAPGQVVAVKIISIEEGDSLEPGAADTLSDILKEVYTLKRLRNSGAKNINAVIDTLLVGHSVWMITEYCAGGSVASLMRPTGGLPEKWIVPILREVAEAIYWVHQEGIIHRDIKCANVLVTELGGVQLCDFGVAGIIETRFDKRRTVTGTLQWMAPELFDTTVSYGMEVDIWAFGSLAYEVASGLPPNATTRIDIPRFGSYLKQNCPRLEGDHYSSQLKDLVAYCMVEDPKLRPHIQQIQTHPYIYNTSEKYPAASLSRLVSAYKAWEAQGGSRQSLFSAGGAQGPPNDLSFNPNDEWVFHDNSGLDQSGLDDAETIYEVDGPELSVHQLPLLHPHRRRRLLPNMKAFKAPLEKLFDPHTISNYADHARAVYTRTTLSDLPLRNDDSAHLTVRESLIDLDASWIDSAPAQVNDLHTIKVRPRSADATDVNRRTQDWTFPAVFPASARLDMSSSDSSFSDTSTIKKVDWSEPDNSTKRRTQDWVFPGFVPPAEIQTLSCGTDGTYIPTEFSRMSALSLIDLDASIAPASMDRPSTAVSDATSSGSENAHTPFEFESHANGPEGAATDREPSIYVSDSDGSRHELSIDVPDGIDVSCPQSVQSNDPSAMPDNTGQASSVPSVNQERTRSIEPPEILPQAPYPVSQNVMQGISSPDEVKDEPRRMISCLGEHLQAANDFMGALPVGV
ncbi:STE/STE20/YSK protein kinase [Colletotrichum abscissum]|uniref:STE/STE20/YSK protein kinase n=1 Tax=Colletotrichum abscissum TaxID=1671311 RepID=UPI0027D58FD5|nr:STE/STE20/YSK protein kinase [Colletotrichum abscissum]KAK1471625.1 STE/STE20/YSK protein kinase [Colletotrichum abscissum]